MSEQSKQAFIEVNGDEYILAYKRTVSTIMYSFILALKELADIHNTSLEEQTTLFLNTGWNHIESLSSEELNKYISELNK